MYHCHLHLYFVGCPDKVIEVIKEMPPLDSFTHEFSESLTPKQSLISKADIIFASTQETNLEHTLQTLCSHKPNSCQLILLTEKKQVSLITDYLPKITDIWILPLSEEELRFRFLKWQQTCKMSKDYWQSEHFLEATINSVPNLIWYKTKDGLHEKVNDSFCKTVNKTKEQVQGRDHYYIWDVDRNDPANANLVCVDSELEVFAKRKTCIFEETVKTGDDIRLLTTYKSPLYDLDGSIMGTVGIGIDVTKERAYEEEIIRKNNVLEMMFTSLDCGILCHSLDGSRIISINDAALKLLGYDSLEEMAEFNMVAQSVLDEDKPVLRKSIKKLKKAGDSTNVEYRVQHKDGSILHIMGNIKLIEENGELFYQRFLLDCTDQKLKEKEQEQRQAALIDALSADYSLVCFFDLDSGEGYMLRTTEQGKNSFSSAMLKEKSLWRSMEWYTREYVHENDREMFRQALRQEKLLHELEKKNQYYVRYRIMRDKEPEYYEIKIVRASLWGLNHGVVLGFRNIDDEIHKEMQHKEQLENALIQANKANKAKSVFLSNMSHDIRTPMNAIIGYTNLSLAHINEKDQVQEYLNKITISGNHLLNLINDILDMSRIENDNIEITETPCSLSEIMHNLTNIMRMDIQAKNLRLHMDSSRLLHDNIYCDNLRLNQVLLNIISNSVKYTNAGGKIDFLIVERQASEEGRAFYEFHIKDTGIGMSPEFITRIFEPFEREKNTTASGIPGTGLGMAITKKLVDLMGGTISVNSRQGEGTEITVVFPFLLNQESALKEKESNLTDTVNFKNCRILLTEDNELNQEIAEAILTDAGFTVDIAENGKIAVDMLQNAAPGYYKLILMDIQMPIMNGYDAAKAIRQLEQKELSSIPILAMTANAFEEDRQKALEAGMNGHIAKPIDTNVLFDMLKKILI